MTQALYRVSFASNFSLEEAWNLLESKDCQILYGSEEEGHVELFVHSSSVNPLAACPGVIFYQPYDLPPIDWESQWAQHGQDFHDGYVHVHINDFSKEAHDLKLVPGPGFGDLSHPTTRLILKFLAKYRQTFTMIDIGCGSGVLSLAAAALGAEKVIGIDIDPEAIEHSQQNAQLNQLEERCHFCLPSAFTWTQQATVVLIAMNMIQSEQETAWNSLPQLHAQPAILLTSGVREEERDIYLTQMEQKEWYLEEEEQEEGWMAFCFKRRV